MCSSERLEGWSVLYDGTGVLLVLYQKGKTAFIVGSPPPDPKNPVNHIPSLKAKRKLLIRQMLTMLLARASRSLLVHWQSSVPELESQPLGI